MKVIYLFILLFLIFFNCKEKEKTQKDLRSENLVEVLGPKEKGIFDSLKVPNHLKKEVKSISNLNYFDSGVIGQENPDIKYATPFSEFEKLKKKASIKEIYQLTFNNNTVVSLYSYTAVAEKIPKLNPIFYSRLLNIQKEIYSKNGCIVGNLKPSEIFYDEYLKNVDEISEGKDLILRKLDSVSIYHNNTTPYVLNQALKHRIYPESFQKRFENLAFKQENPYVLIYLSKKFRERYKNQLQKSIISYLKETIDEPYPDYCKNTLTVELMRFKNPDNKNLIEKILKNNFILKNDEKVNQLKKSNGILY